MDECIEAKWGHAAIKLHNKKIIGRDDFFGIGFVMPAHSHVMRFLFMQPLYITKQVKLIIVFGSLFDYYNK